VALELASGVSQKPESILKKEKEMRRPIAALKTLIRLDFLLIFILGLFLASGCGKKQQESELAQQQNAKDVVKEGDVVKVEYKGSLEDGTVFDESKEGEPLIFVVGSGQIIPGFDKAVVGMKLNEEKKVTIQKEDAYGERDETLVKVFPRNILPENLKPRKDMILSMRDNNGRILPAKVVEVTADSLTLDLNHPLAGKNLVFDIKVIGIE